MPFIPVPNTWRVTVNQTYSGIAIVNVFHVTDDDPTFFNANTEPNGLAEDVWNNWRDEIMPHLADTISLVSVDVVDINEEDGRQGTFADVAEAGSIASQSLPANTAFLVQKRTGLSGRNFRGRMYVAGVTEGDWAGGGNSDLPPATVAAFQADLTDFLEGLEDGSRGPLEDQRYMSIASLYDGTDNETGKPIPRAVGVTARVTSLTLDRKVATQRRRMKR